MVFSELSSLFKVASVSAGFSTGFSAGFSIGLSVGLGGSGSDLIVDSDFNSVLISGSGEIESCSGRDWFKVTWILSARKGDEFKVGVREVARAAAASYSC